MRMFFVVGIAFLLGNVSEHLLKRFKTPVKRNQETQTTDSLLKEPNSPVEEKFVLVTNIPPQEHIREANLCKHNAIHHYVHTYSNPVVF